jgi:diadenosine tetraphosphate (Ap4A) HIT family hydrolase
MGDVCPICERGVPNDAVAELPGAWVTLPPRAPVPGYVVVVAKRHVREPFELPASERREFWDAVDLVAEAIQAGLRPDKLNYEIHGNTIPHLHLHLFPRWSGDRFSGRPIDLAETEPRSAEDAALTLAAIGRLRSRAANP